MKTLYDFLTMLVPFLAPYPSWVKLLLLGGVVVVVLVVVAMVAVLVMTQPQHSQQVAAQQLVQNGSFEQGLANWGSGYVEDLVRNGNHPQPPQFPWVVSRAPQSTGTVDTAEHHNPGIASFRIVHTSPKADHSWGTLSQRITGLSSHTFYIITFWAKVRSSEPKAVFLTASLTWEPNYKIPPSQSDWQQHRFEFNTGERDSIDLRFVAQAPAHLWIDDIRMEQRSAGQVR
jgi:hypothetical protein